MPYPFSPRAVLLPLIAAGLFSAPALAADAPRKADPAAVKPATKPAAKPATKPTPKPAAKPAPKPAKPIVEAPQGLDPTTLYQYLLAEIAAGRGELGVASEAYMELARRIKDPAIARRATEVAVQARQGLWALEAARLWVEADPTSVPAMQTLALLQASAGGKPEEVEKTLARLFAASVEARNTLLPQLPRLYGGIQDKKQVLASVLRLTEPYLSLPEARLARSQAYLDAELRGEAEANARQALALRPGWERAALQIAQAAAAGREEAAMEELGAFGKQYPQARGARVGYLRWLTATGRKDAARGEYRRLLADFPQDDDVAFTVVQTAMQLGDHAAAEPLIRRLIAAQYRDADMLRVQLGQELEKAGRDGEAQAIYESVAPGRDYLAARAALAGLLARQGKLADARALLQQSATVQPERASAFLIAESELLVKQGMVADASTLLETALSSRGEDTELLYQAGMVAERANRLDLMENHMRKLMRLRPDHAHAYNALGYTLADRNVRLDEAESLLLRALSLDGEDAAILDSVGWLYFRKGQYPQAIDYLQRSYARMPDHEVAAHLVEALWAAGRQGEARSVLDGARKANPQSELLNKLANRLAQ